MGENSGTARRHLQVAGVALAGVVVGLGGTLVVDAASDEARLEICPASAADLERAAEEARRLELRNPAAFEASPRPADYYDLRLAAEWARRLAILAPHTIPEYCHR